MRLYRLKPAVALAALLGLQAAIAGGAPAAGPRLDPALARSAYVEEPGARRPLSALTRPRLQPVGAEATQAQRNVIEAFAGTQHGSNALRTLVHAPQRPPEFMPLFDYVETESTLSPRDRELLVLRAAWLTQSRYLWARHVPRAMQAGFDSRQIRAIARGPHSGWNGNDRMLLALADELFRNASVTDATWSNLSARYDLNQTLDAVVTASNMIESGILFNSLGVQPDDGAPAFALPGDIRYAVFAPRAEPRLATARVAPVEGNEIAIMRTIRRHPLLATRWYAMPSQRGDPDGEMSAHDRELVVLRMGWNNQSDYEWAQHVGSVGRAREQGIDPMDVARGVIGRSWSDRDRALLRAVDEMHRDSMVSDATWKDLQQHFRPGPLVALLATAARYRRVSMVLNVLGLQPMADEERLPRLVN